MRTQRRGSWIPAALLLAAPCGAAQSVTFGAVAGFNLTQDVHQGTETIDMTGPTSVAYIVDSGGRNPILGLKVEYGLPHAWGLEVDALHREVRPTSSVVFTAPGIPPMVTGPRTQTVSTWEFPVLAKYRFSVGKAALFLEAGPSFRNASNQTYFTHTGVAAGAGLEFRAGGLRIAPTVRYTRWHRAADYAPGHVGKPVLDQVEFLVGFDRPATSGISAFGLPLSIGAIAGIGLGQDFQPPAAGPVITTESNSGIYGIAVETPLPKNWLLEVDGLYRPLHGMDAARGRFAHLTWEFPVLLKYRFRDGSRWRPLVEAGPSFRTQGNPNLQPVSRFGATAGAGIEMKLASVRVAPTLRYTRWRDQGSTAEAHASPNQTQFLVSFSY